MAATTTPRERRHQATREEILEAAWELAERDGIAGLTLRRLARQVGMQAPSLYTYFPSKDAIYDAMFAEGYRMLDERMEELVPHLDPHRPLQSLVMAGERFLAFCQESIPRYQLMFTRAIPGWEPSPAAYRVSVASYQRSEEVLAQLGIRGPEALDLYTALLSGLAAQQIANDPGGERWIRLLPQAMQMLLDHLEQKGTE